MKARISPAKTLPDPTIGIRLMNMGNRLSLGKDMDSMVGISFSQMVPYAGKLPLMGKIMEEDANQMFYMLQEKRWMLTAEVKKTYYSIYHTDRMLEILQENKTILENMEKSMEAMYQVGEALQQDVLKAQVAISKLLEQMLDLRRQRRELEARMNRLLGRSVTAPIGNLQVSEEISLPYTLEDFRELALEYSPTLRVEEKGISRAEYQVKLAEREFKPDAMFTYSRFARGNFGPAWEAMMEITVPLYKEKKQAFQLIEARQTKEQAEQALQGKKNEILQGLDEMFAALQTNEEIYHLLVDGIIPQAELTFRASMSAYQVGKVDFLTTLDSLMTLYDMKMRLHMTLEMFHKDLSDVEAMIGKSLEIHSGGETHGIKTTEEN